METDLLILGGSIAGTTVAEAVRHTDATRSILIVSAESEPLYSRVLLPNLIKQEVPEEKVRLRRLVNYHTLNIAVLWGEEAIALDRRTRKVTLASGKTVTYRQLVLATGGKARPLPLPQADLPGVQTLRTLADAHHIQTELITAQTTAVVGDSFIALEFLGILLKAKLPVHLILRTAQLFPELISAAGAALLEAWLTDQGVVIHRQAQIRTIIGATHLEAIEVAGTTIAADFLGVGIGMELNTQLATSAGLEVNTGVVTDSSFRTSDPNIFAVGDLAEFYHPLFAEHQLLGNWTHAVQSARVAAQALTGHITQYSSVTSYTSSALPFPVSMIGSVRGKADRMITETGDRNRYPSLVELKINSGRCTAAVLINRPDLQGPARVSISSGRPIADSVTTVTQSMT